MLYFYIMKALTLNHKEVTRENLLKVTISIPGAWIGIKVAALLLVLEDKPRGWISELFGIDRVNLSRWINRVNVEGLKGLEERPRSGRPSQLTEEVCKELEEHLEKEPLEFGLERFKWDGPTLSKHLREYFGIRIKVRQAQYWMHKLGYTVKRASYTYMQARVQDAKRFKKGFKKNSKI